MQDLAFTLPSVGNDLFVDICVASLLPTHFLLKCQLLVSLL